MQEYFRDLWRGFRGVFFPSSRTRHPSVFTAEVDKGMIPGCLVMELVEGPTLAERIKEGHIPLEEALPIARQTAAALEAAHEKGITRRDLKPGNIKIKADGTVKVLDFGLAKVTPRAACGSVSPDLEESPTLSMAATRAGVVPGDGGLEPPK